MKNKTQKGGISRYCEKHGITMTDLGEIVFVSFSQLYLINKYPLYPVKIITLERIYQNTKKKFGDGLKPEEYLDFEILRK